jgi:hypothetical protein
MQHDDAAMVLVKLALVRNPDIVTTKTHSSRFLKFVARSHHQISRERRKTYCRVILKGFTQTESNSRSIR